MSHISTTEAFNNKYPSEFSELSMSEEQEAREEYQTIIQVENEVKAELSSKC